MPLSYENRVEADCLQKHGKSVASIFQNDEMLKSNNSQVDTTEEGNKLRLQIENEQEEPEKQLKRMIIC